MIPSRVLFPILVLAAFGANSLHAATINVTTLEDLVEDNDEQCSLREALAATVRADIIRQRETGLSRIETDRTTLQGQLPRLRTRPEETFSRSALLGMMTSAKTELEAHEELDPALIAEIDAFLGQIDAPQGQPKPPAPRLEQVETAIDIQERAILRILDPGPDEKKDTDDDTGELPKLTGKDKIDGCRDASAFDVILLGEGTYVLDSELAMDGRATIRGRGVDKTTITTGTTSQRLVKVGRYAQLELDALRMTGGNLSCASGSQGDGGALFVSGNLQARNVLLIGNKACNGGAIHLDSESSSTYENVQFADNEASGNGGAINALSALTVTDSLFGLGTDRLSAAPNRAVGDGGAIFFSPQGDATWIKIDRAVFVNNEGRNGSAIFIGGDNVLLSGIENVTIARNRASGRAALYASLTGSSDERFRINNLTMLGNTASSGTAGLYTGSFSGFRLSNSLLAGNAGGSCDVAAVRAALTEAQWADFSKRFTRNYYGAETTCPGYRYQGAVPEDGLSPEYYNYALASDVDPVGVLVLDMTKGGVFAPIYPVEDGLNLLVDRGASTQDQTRCSEIDQRNNNRTSFVDVDCDIGAVEYQLGRRVDDSFDILINETACVDVAVNDIGDARYVAGSLEVLSDKFAEDHPGAKAIVLRRNGDGSENDEIDRRCPNAEEINEADPDRGRDVVLVTPARGFRGETLLPYRLSWQTQGEETVVSGDVTAYARVFTESAGGIGSSQLAGYGLHAMLLLVLAAFRRAGFFSRGVLLAALFGLPGIAPANENRIFVNSGQDDLVPVAGDGKCTLREALNTARNDQANLSGGDCVNGNEGPDIVEFLPNEDDSEEGYVERYEEDSRDQPGKKVKVTRIVVRINDTLTSFGGVTLRCPEVQRLNDNSMTDAQLDAEMKLRRNECVIRRDENLPSTEEGGRPFALINSEGGLTVIGMILEGGDAGPLADGGAINSRGGLSISNSIIRNNRARTGGAIFLRGSRSGLYVGSTTFEENVSTGNEDDGISRRLGGGAIATTAADEHRVDIESSTFYRNRSATSGAALSIKSIRPIVIANSTFTENTSTAGAGAIDISDARGGATLRNLTVVNNQSGTGMAALEAASVTIANSIIAGNGGTDCGRGSFFGEYNIIGTGCTGLEGKRGTRKVDGGSVLSRLGALEENGGYTRTMAPRNPEDDWIVNKGFESDLSSNDALVQPLESGRLQCAVVDQRGISRESGGRCDIGAYEYLRITAVDDQGTNLGRFDRDVLMDVLANDLFAPDPGKGIRRGCARQEYEGSLLVLRDASGNPCMEVRVKEGDAAIEQVRILPGDSEEIDEAVRKNITSPYVVYFTNAEDPSEGILYGEDPALSLAYVIYTEDSPQGGASERSSEGVISIGVENIPPLLVDRATYANWQHRVAVGSVVELDLLDKWVDHDGPTRKPDPSTITLTGDACTERAADPADHDGDGDVEESYWHCRFGGVTIDPSTGVLTWVPFNNYNPFTETITYGLKDAEDKEGTGSLSIIMSRPYSSGGSLVMENDPSNKLGIDFLGATGHLWLFLSGFLGLRRWFRRRSA